MATPLIAYPILAIAPLAFHMSAQFGRLLIQPVRTSVPVFDRTYNRWPWLPSLLCGLCLVAAQALSSVDSALASVFWAAAVALFSVDLLGCSIAIYGYVKKRR